jgi:uncharacterized membrane protein
MDGVDREGIVASHYKCVAYYFHNTVGWVVIDGTRIRQAIGAERDGQ